MKETKLSEFARNKIMNFTINGKKVVREIDLSNIGQWEGEYVIEILLNENFIWDSCSHFMSKNVTQVYSDLKHVEEVPNGLTYDEYIKQIYNN